MTIQCHSPPRAPVSSLLPAATNQFLATCVRCPSLTPVQDTQHCNVLVIRVQIRQHDTASTVSFLGHHYEAASSTSSSSRNHAHPALFVFQPLVHVVWVSHLSETRSTVHTTQFLKPASQSITMRSLVLHRTDSVSSHHLHAVLEITVP